MTTMGAVGKVKGSGSWVKSWRWAEIVKARMVPMATPRAAALRTSTIASSE